MVFLASSLPKDHVFTFSNAFSEVSTTAKDGIKLHGILFKTENSKGLIFFWHGNKGTVDMWGRDAAFYNNLGYDIFYADYRGFGKSEGQIEDQEQVLNDAILVFDDIQNRLQPKQTIIFGYSIGTGIATYIASKRKCSSLILVAPFYNFTEFTRKRVPFFPDSFKKFSFDTNKYIKKVKCPITIFHGDNDYVIPIENGLKLKKLLKPADHFYMLKNAGHIGINQNTDFQKIMSKIKF